MSSIGQVQSQNTSANTISNPTVAIVNKDKSESKLENEPSVNQMSQKLNKSAEPVVNPISSEQTKNIIPEANTMFKAQTGGITAEFVSSLLDKNPYLSNAES